MQSLFKSNPKSTDRNLASTPAIKQGSPQPRQALTDDFNELGGAFEATTRDQAAQINRINTIRDIEKARGSQAS